MHEATLPLRRLGLRQITTDLDLLARLGFVLSSPIPGPGTRAAEDPPLRECDMISTRVDSEVKVEAVYETLPRHFRLRIPFQVQPPLRQFACCPSSSFESRDW